MNAESLYRKLDTLKRGLLLAAGWAIALFLVALMGPHPGSYNGWFLAWFIVQIGAPPLGLMLLVSRDWRALPFEDLKGTAFGYLAVGWLSVVSVTLQMGLSLQGGASMALSMAALTLFGAMILTLWWALNRQARAGEKGEEMFP